MKFPEFTDFYDAWYFISTHPANSLDRIRRLPRDSKSHFRWTFDFTVEKVNPRHVTSYGSFIKEYDKDKRHLNTKTEVWLEYGEVRESQETKDGYEYCHDLELNCSGNTFEEAVIRLANLMNENEYYQKMFRDDDDGSKAFRI